MSQSLSQIYLHIVFSTKNRFPFIDSKIESELYSYIGGTIKNQKGIPILINGTADHVHILSTFPRTTTVSNFIKEIKTSSSIWKKTKGVQFEKFAWQEGYGVFSVSASKTQVVSNYISKQKEHHHKQTFQEELLLFLKEYGIQYDEHYLWD